MKRQLLNTSIILYSRKGYQVYGVIRYIDPKGRFIKVEVDKQLIIVLNSALGWLQDDYTRVG